MSARPFTKSTRPGGSGSADIRETWTLNLSLTGPPTRSADASTVTTEVAARAVPWMPPGSMVSFVLLSVSPCADGVPVLAAWLSSPCVYTIATGTPRFVSANARRPSRRDSTAPLANTRPGASAAQTLVTATPSSRVESATGGPAVSVKPLRTCSFAPNGRESARPPLRVLPVNMSTVSTGLSAVALVRYRPQRPGAGSRMLILSPVATQPKISDFEPAGPQAAPLGETARKLSPVVAPISRRGEGGIGVGAAGAAAPSAIVTCIPAGTVTTPPAVAVTCRAPSSAWKVVCVPPVGSGCTSVRKPVPRTAAVLLGVLTSNRESGVLSFCTADQLRPRVCSMVTWMPSPGTLLSAVTLTCEPGSTESDEPSKKVSTARPSVLARTRSPLL